LKQLLRQFGQLLAGPKILQFITAHKQFDWLWKSQCQNGIHSMSIRHWPITTVQSYLS